MVRTKSVSRLLLLPACLIAMLTLPAFARVDPPHPAVDPHHIDGSSLGGPIDISSSWLLQQGDDPQWANPDLNDSHWLLVKSDGPSLSSYGLKSVDRLWYRTHVKISPGAKNVSIWIRDFAGSWQVFVNGVLVGGSRSFPPQGEVYVTNSSVYAIPPSCIGTGDVVIAIRGSIGRSSSFGHWPAGIGPGTAIFLGTTTTLADASSLYTFRGYTSNFTNITLKALLFLIAIALATTLKNEREYQALLVYLTAYLFVDGSSLWSALHSQAYTATWLVLRNIPRAILFIAELEFVVSVLKLQRNRILVWYEWVFFIGKYSADCYTDLNGIHGLLTSRLVINANIAVFTPLFLGMPIFALWAWWRRRTPDALLLFVPLFLQTAFAYYYYARGWLFDLHLVQTYSIGYPPIPALYVSWWEVTDFLFSVTLLVFVVLRTLRIAGGRAKVATEIAAAQTMQQVLLARACQPTPGFEVESIYHPAGEVGGDFFLVSPGPNESLTAIVGDVSGKGLVAAMRVSMILGVLRREDSRDPCGILVSLNDALLAQGDVGFTTACCVRLDRNGHYAIANAGHISPYVNGDELVAPPALPLGLASGQDYDLLHGQLYPGQKLVLMSDGVVEARSQKGELYGFDRLALLTMKPAQEIADTAQKFGQEDDITVLTIACCA